MAGRAKAYHRTKLILSLVSTGIEWAYLLLLVLTPLAAWLVELTGVSANPYVCLLYTSPSPRDQRGSRMPSSA